jgi:hypothetical protein
MYEKFRGNLKWCKNLEKKKFSWKPNKNINLLDKDELKKIDVYNFEIKTYNFINKFTINDFPKNIPIVILWSPYFDSSTKISTEKVNIINKMNKKLDKYKNITYLFMNAPHQMERVIPITLSNFIINTIIK